MAMVVRETIEFAIFVFLAIPMCSSSSSQQSREGSRVLPLGGLLPTFNVSTRPCILLKLVEILLNLNVMSYLIPTLAVRVVLRETVEQYLGTENQEKKCQRAPNIHRSRALITEPCHR